MQRVVSCNRLSLLDAETVSGYKPGDPRIKEDWVKKQAKIILSDYQRILVDMPPANMYGSSGRHDFIICQAGYYWTIETKAGKNKPTANQKSFARLVYQAGGFSLLVNEFNLADVKKAADWIAHAGLGDLLPAEFTEWNRAC